MKKNTTNRFHILPRYWMLSLVIGSILLTMGIASCDADLEVDRTVEEIESEPPTITGFSPQSVNLLGEVTIEGTFLNFVDEVFINGQQTTIKSRVSEDKMVITVDAGVTSGPITVVNVVNRENAENLRFEATSAETLDIQYPVPEVTSSIPTNAVVNDLLIIEGTNIDLITRVSFGDVDGIISFQENLTAAIQVPNPGTLAPVEVRIWYGTETGEVSQLLSSNLTIEIPAPEVDGPPAVMTRDNEVVFRGGNLNLTTSITVNGLEAIINQETLEDDFLAFTVPSGLSTGTYDVVFTDTENRETTFRLPYIDGEYLEIADFDLVQAGAWSLDLGEDPLATHEVITDPERQPKLPDGTQFGSGIYRINYGTRDGSTVARLNAEDVLDPENLERLSNILDGTSFGGDPWIHFWMRTEDKPTFRFYLGDPRRELDSDYRSTGGEWILIAVALKDFVTGANPAGMNFRPSPSSSETEPEMKFAEYDWFIITDRRLTEFGAVDYTDTTSTTEFWRAQ